MMETAQRWWGPTRLRAGDAARWQIGSCSLWLLRGRQELRLATRYEADALATDLVVAEPAPAEPPADHVLRRYALPDGDAPLELRPLLADRAVVARPETPFTLTAGGSCRFFTSTPLWVQIHAGAPICEFPLQRPSDTWFGPSTMEGELCYASRVGLHLARERLAQTPHRAIAAVGIANDGTEPLPLHRLRLPLPQLALWVAADGTFHTGSLDVTWDGAAGADSARVQVDDGPPPWAPGAERVADPREPGADNPALRVFNSLFR